MANGTARSAVGLYRKLAAGRRSGWRLRGRPTRRGAIGQPGFHGRPLHTSTQAALSEHGDRAVRHSARTRPPSARSRKEALTVEECGNGSCA